jgi:transcriptional regulator of arginine metabolism
MSISKAVRQEKILKIVASGKLASLSQIREELAAAGIGVDISTLSRDISEIHVGKKDGFYQVPDSFDLATRVLPSKHLTFRHFVLHYESVGPFAVVTTIPGAANAVAIQIDARKDELDCAGTVAGDDTVFVLLRSKEAARRFLGWLDESRAASPEADAEP